MDHYMYTWQATKSARTIYLFIDRLSEIHTLWCPSPILGAVFPHRYYRSFLAMVYSHLPDFFPDALRDLLRCAVTNSPLPPDGDNTEFPDCTFPHPNLSHLSLQHPNPVVSVGPPSQYAALFGARFLERYDSQLTACINSLIKEEVNKTYPGSWDAQLLPEMKKWLIDSMCTVDLYRGFRDSMLGVWPIRKRCG